MHRLVQAINDGAYVLDMRATDMDSICHQALSLLVAQNVVPAERRDALEEGFRAREAQAPTAIGHSVAVPHVYADECPRPTIVFVRLARPINLGAPDGIPTQFVFLLLGPTDATTEHLDSLATIARLMSDDEFRYDAKIARNRDDLLDALRHYEGRREPPRGRPADEKEVSESLQYTGRLFGGMIQDIHRRWPHFRSDFTDGLHAKSISSVLFLYFACLAPAIIFGGIMAEKTGNHIGAVEMIVATFVCGVIYALLSGQPLIILGGTGPLLVFTWALYLLCQQFEMGSQFLEIRAWVGIWTALILLVLAATDASWMMRYFTRFTDEIFAALISFIFIVWAIENLVDIVSQGYETNSTSHDEALVPLLLAMGTFYVAITLSRFRRSRFLLPKMREFFSDFGPAIALVVMTAASVMWFHSVKMDTLQVPETLRPTIDSAADAGTPRPWLLNFFHVPVWIWFATVLPALLVVVLAFMDQNITARLVNNPDHKLEKGEAYHHDLALIGVLIGVCSLFGLPWLVAATVRSLNHVRSLATVEEVVARNGETRERVIHVQENRISALAIHILIGCSIILLPLLRLIPMSVLYGLFLFMGAVSIAGNQFFERLSLWVMDRNLYPSTHYIRKVPNQTIHLFTLLQLVCLIPLVVIERTPLRILFPLLILILVPIRMIAGRFFLPEHLEALDADEEPEEEETQWV